MICAKMPAKGFASIAAIRVVLNPVKQKARVSGVKDTDKLLHGQTEDKGECLKKMIRYSPSICVTHSCNLNCVYCYQKNHSHSERMSIETAKVVIDRIFGDSPNNTEKIGIDFIGGEPLLEFDLIREIVAYTRSKPRTLPYIFFATTNGTLLSKESKTWFTENKDSFVLGLSLDGTRDTQNYNRSDSFDKIDTDFFISKWPWQGVKMTISDYSIQNLADNIKFIHSLGFKKIRGANLAEGCFDWSESKYIEVLIPQLAVLVDFYLENGEGLSNQMFDKRIAVCEAKEHKKRKWCGTGLGCPLFDIDGTKYPCAFMTPMTFPENELSEIMSTDFSNHELFVDDECFQCYLYPICPNCAGANFLNSKSFKFRDKRRCKIQKLFALFLANLEAKKIVKNPKIYDVNTLNYTIEAIKKIRSLYFHEFQDFI